MTDNKDQQFEYYVEKYTPLMYRQIRNIFVDGYTREDLFQECLMVLHKAIETFDDSRGASFMTYLYNLLRNMIANLLEKQAREKVPNLVYVDFNSAVINNEMYNANNDNVEDMETTKEVVDYLMTLPRGEITFLHFMGGLTQQEIADMEGISKQRVNALNKRNIDRLREHYKAGGFTF